MKKGLVTCPGSGSHGQSVTPQSNDSPLGQVQATEQISPCARACDLHHDPNFEEWSHWVKGTNLHTDDTFGDWASPCVGTWVGGSTGQARTPEDCSQSQQDGPPFGLHFLVEPVISTPACCLPGLYLILLLPETRTHGQCGLLLAPEPCGVRHDTAAPGHCAACLLL